MTCSAPSTLHPESQRRTGTEKVSEGSLSAAAMKNGTCFPNQTQTGKCPTRELKCKRWELKQLFIFNIYKMVNIMEHGVSERAKEPETILHTQLWRASWFEVYSLFLKSQEDETRKSKKNESFFCPPPWRRWKTNFYFSNAADLILQLRFIESVSYSLSVKIWLPLLQWML